MKYTFTPGTVVVFDQSRINQDWWKAQTEEDLKKWYGPLGYGSEKPVLFVFLCEILSGDGYCGHCVLVNLDNQQIETMRHTSDFRAATEEEF